MANGRIIYHEKTGTPSWFDYQTNKVEPMDEPALTKFADEAAVKNGIDPKLVREVIRQESQFNPAAVSPKGAIGPMQLMPNTAKELGVDPEDPRQNIVGGVTYLKRMHDRYKGDLEKTLAAYNAGPEAVDSGEYTKYPETVGYVKNIFGRLQNPSAPFTSPQAEQTSKALPGIVQQQGTAKSLTPPPTGTSETLGALQVAPKTVHDATVDVLKKDLGLGKIGDVLGAAVPSSWSEVAALTSILLPPPARMAGALGRLIVPTVAGGAAGTISGEGGLAGATTGLLTGAGGEVGRGLNRAITQVGKTTYNLGQEMLLKFDEKFGPGTGKAIMDSIPSLKAAGIDVKNANDMRRLVTQDAGVSKVGKLFDDIEERIVKKVKDRIQMPVDERVGIGTTIGRRQGSTTSAGYAESSGTSSATARRAGQSRGQIASDVTTTTTPMSERGEIPIVRNVVTEGTRGPAISSSVSATEGGRAGTTMSSADRFTRGQTEASTRSSRITTKQPGHVPMTPENARAYIKELRDSGSPLYGKAQEAFRQAVERADKGLAKEYDQVVNDYSSIKAFQTVFGKPENIDLIFPYLGKRGHGFDIGHFAQVLNSEAVRLGSDVGRFGPVYKYLGGGSPVEGAGPALMESRPFRAFLRIPGTPVGVPLSTAPSAGHAVKKALKVELTPDLAAAIQRNPALGELLRRTGLDRAAGGYVGGRVGQEGIDWLNR